MAARERQTRTHSATRGLLTRVRVTPAYLRGRSARTHSLHQRSTDLRCCRLHERRRADLRSLFPHVQLAGGGLDFPEKISTTRRSAKAEENQRSE